MIINQLKSQHHNQKTLKQHVEQIAKEQGYNSITNFINAWIKSGETFRSLQQWLILEKDIIYDDFYIWQVLRDYLTIPYDYADQFWYKWNAVARIKGYTDGQHMAKSLMQQKLNLYEIAEELGINKGKTGGIIQRLVAGPGEIPPISMRRRIRSLHRRRDHNGLALTKRRKIWQTRLAKLGFKGLRQAIRILKRKGFLYKEIAQVLGISARGLRIRREKMRL